MVKWSSIQRDYSMRLTPIDRRPTIAATQAQSTDLETEAKRRYRLTAKGRQVAVLFTKTYGRIITPGLSVMGKDLPETVAKRSPLATAWRRLEGELDEFMAKGFVAA